MKLTYHIKGMHCAACTKKIRSALTSHFNVINVTLHPPELQIETDKPPQMSELNSYLSVAGKYEVQSTDEDSQSGLSTYYPIFLITLYIIGVATLNNVHGEKINWYAWMNQFMAGFFLVFSAFKLLDIRGFAEGYSTYDLLARHWYPYGYIYPFLELSLGILYLTQWQPIATQIATVIIMGFSSLGVINSLIKKQKIQCACLGTILKVPLSSVTLIEDLTMVIMATIALMMSF